MVDASTAGEEPQPAGADGENSIDFFDQDFQKNPKGTFADIHKSGCPYAKGEKVDYYAIAGYDEIVKTCRDTDMWSSKWGPGLRYYSPDEARALVNVDPPEHDWQVQIVRKAFAGPYIQALEDGIRKFCGDRIDDFIAKGSCDIHAEYSVPLPLFVICELLGLDYEDAENEGFRDWVVRGTSATIIDPTDKEKYEDALHGHQQMVDYFVPRLKDWTARIERGEADPDENLITRLVSADFNGTKLPENKILGFCCFLLGAGSTTTTTVMSNLMYRLAVHPEQRRKLAEDPSLAAAAVEESLRVDAPVHGLFRTNNEEVDLGPFTLQPDTKVALLWAAGNVDPSVWDRPLEFDISRDMKDLRRNLAFGNGIHVCLGSSLARLELKVAMEEFIKRIPDFELDGEPTISTPDVLSGFDALPLRWETR